MAKTTKPAAAAAAPVEDVPLVPESDNDPTLLFEDEVPAAAPPLLQTAGPEDALAALVLAGYLAPAADPASVVPLAALNAALARALKWVGLRLPTGTRRLMDDDSALSLLRGALPAGTALNVHLKRDGAYPGAFGVPYAKSTVVEGVALRFEAQAAELARALVDVFNRDLEHAAAGENVYVFDVAAFVDARLQASGAGWTLAQLEKVPAEGHGKWVAREAATLLAEVAKRRLKATLAKEAGVRFKHVAMFRARRAQQHAAAAAGQQKL